LKGVASALGVSTKDSQARGEKGAYKAKGGIIEEVLQKVEQLRCIVPGSAAEADQQRREARLVPLLQRAVVMSARKEIALLPGVVGADIEQMRDDVLFFEWPDELRQRIGSEFIAKHGVLAREDAADLG
jgi:hypothetical protein